MSSKINKHILQYIQLVESGELQACKEQFLLCKLIRYSFANEDIYTDDEQLENYLSLSKYYPFEQLYPWEEFLLALHCCTYWNDTGLPRWPDLFALMGRGAGKDGYISFQSFALLSEYNNINNYDVDICANNEEQAKAPFMDLYNVFEEPANTKKLGRFFYWNKETITSLKTKAVMKYRTNSPKGKDGLRSGNVIFNEIHQYLNYENINVFTTGLGKKKHPRRSYITTQGDIRGGPLDDYLDKSEDILKGVINDNGWLPFICKLDNKNEVHNKITWPKANPSLPYNQTLMAEMEKEYIDWVRNPSQFTAFMTKRMNIPDVDREFVVTSWENILATNQEIPDLSGSIGVIGLDASMLNDFASVGILIGKGNLRYFITHSWLCLNSPTISYIKAPYKEWAKDGHLTLVDDVEINPDLLADWIYEKAKEYNLVHLALDNYRLSVVKKSLEKIGFSTKFKNITCIRPSDVMRVVPIIDSYFLNHKYVFGDNPVMRWAVNNTKKVKASKKIGSDTGNYYYAKIEAKSRKTDPFMSLVATMTLEDKLVTSTVSLPDLDVVIY